MAFLNNGVLALLNADVLAFVALAGLDQRRTPAVVPVGDLAVQAVVALVGVDPAVVVDCLDLTLAGAELAGLAAFRPAAQPVEQPQPGGNGQGGPQRAEILAIELLTAVRSKGEQFQLVSYLRSKGSGIAHGKGLI